MRRNETITIPEDVSFKAWHHLTWWICTDNSTVLLPPRSGWRQTSSLTRHSTLLLYWLFYPENGDQKFFRNTTVHPSNYTVSHPWRPSYLYSRARRTETSCSTLNICGSGGDSCFLVIHVLKTRDRTLRDFRLPPRSSFELRSSELLRSK
jgi:hypothetical protein